MEANEKEQTFSEQEQVQENRLKKILIVDDEPTTVFLLKVRLAQSDYDILVAEDGEQGFWKAKEERPDLIILDVMLPNMGGFEICSKLKKDEALCHIPVVMLSARCGDIDQRMGSECGSNAYFGKPCDVKNLLKVIANLLEGK